MLVTHMWHGSANHDQSGRRTKQDGGRLITVNYVKLQTTVLLEISTENLPHFPELTLTRRETIFKERHKGNQNQRLWIVSHVRE